ncbi:MAG: TonB family protein [Calditrichaeota bacterium]|nr:MAG: TonB family protein [Calditrichota bacterium]
MKLNLLLSSALHALLFVAMFVTRPGVHKFEGYPVVVPVELVKVEPVSFKAPEVERLKPRARRLKPQPKKLEGVTVEKRKLEKEPEERPPKQVEEPKDSNKGKSAVGGKSLRLDVAEFPFSYYLALIQSRIQANWEPPFDSSGRTLSKMAIVYFKIQRNGQITGVAVETGSGDYLFDQAALRAVTLANPLPPLPFDFPGKNLGVHFEFDQGK